MGMSREATVAHILSSAERVFGRVGFGGATMAVIARTATLPKANIHYYFRTKEELYRAVLEHTLTGWLADAERWLTPGIAAADGLRGYIAAKLTFSHERPHASRLFAHEVLQGADHLTGYFSSRLRTHIDLIDKTFRLWAARGEIRPVNTPHFMFSLWAMTQAYADMNAQFTTVLDRKALTSQDFADAAAHIMMLLETGVIRQNHGADDPPRNAIQAPLQTTVSTG